LGEEEGDVVADVSDVKVGGGIYFDGRWLHDEVVGLSVTVSVSAKFKFTVDSWELGGGAVEAVVKELGGFDGASREVTVVDSTLTGFLVGSTGVVWWRGD
jgi:hypothetical protein